MQTPTFVAMERSSSFAIAGGLIIGVVVGLLMDNIGAGIGIGIALAIALGWTTRKKPSS